MHSPSIFKFLALTTLLTTGLPAIAQNYGVIPSTGSMTSSYGVPVTAGAINQSYGNFVQPYGGIAMSSSVVMEEPFDYPFDRQYNSTVKPYLRWYFRQSPDVQQEYYHRFRQMYGYRVYRIPERTNCGISYREVVVDLMPEIPRRRRNAALDFNPAPDYEPDQPKTAPKLDYTPFGEGERERGLNYERDRSSQLPVNGMSSNVQAKTVWISRSNTGSTSVLYVEPPESSAKDFYRAIALMSKGEIQSVRWSQEPPWAAEYNVANN